MSIEFMILCVLAVITSAGVVYSVRRWALQHMLDIPNERSSHSIPTPRGGGLGIVVVTVTFWAAAMLLQWIEVGKNVGGILTLINGGALIATLGWLDDRSNLSAKLRLGLQALIGVVAVLLVGAVTKIQVPVIDVIIFAPVIALILNIIWVVGFTNIYNFMDGIDGLAGSQAMIAGIGWAAAAFYVGLTDLSLFAALIAASSLGFLFLNRPRALIFMGDVGSTFLGLSFALLPLVVFARTGNLRAMSAGAVFVAPFVLDGTLTLLRRFLLRENVLKPHRTHVYQRLIQLGYSHLQVTAIYIAFAAVSAICGYINFTADTGVELGLSVIVPITLFIGLAVWTNWQEIGAARKTDSASIASSHSTLKG